MWYKHTHTHKQWNTTQPKIDEILLSMITWMGLEYVISKIIEKYHMNEPICGIKKSVQSPSHVWLFVTPLTAAHQASLSITNSRCLLKPMSIESVMPSNHLILCRPLLLLHSVFPSIRVFPRSQFFASGGRNIGVSVSTSALPMNIQDWSPLGWTGWISLLSKGLSRVFSNTAVQKHQFFSTQLSL